MTTTTTKEAQHLHRLVLFSDAVFAIAITLLAIEIHPPEHFTGVADFFGQMHEKLSAYVVSFAVIGINWISHRRTLMRLERADGVLDVLNFLMLGLVALLPLGTELLWESGSGAAALIYVGLVASIGLALALAWGYAAFIGHLTEPMSLSLKIYMLLRVALLPGLMCGLTLFSIASRTPWGYVAIGLVIVAMSLGGRIQRKKA